MSSASYVPLPAESEVLTSSRQTRGKGMTRRSLRMSTEGQSQATFNRSRTMGAFPAAQYPAPGSAAAHARERKAVRAVARARGVHKSWIARMLSPTSKSRPAQVYQSFSAFIITFSVAMFLLSTLPELHPYKRIFHVIDGVTSSIFVLDYALRILTVPERTRYREFHPALARLRWVFSWEAIVDALSAFPYFIDIIDGKQSFISFTWLRIFRIFLLFKTSRYSNAVSTAYRVLFVNREILIVCASLVSFFVLMTSTLLYVFADNELRHVNGFGSVPSSMYMAVLMLTGQGGPDGDLSTEMKCVVAFTAMLSVPFFAVPAAMMTWGFEGEAERLAAREKRRVVRKRVYRDHPEEFCKCLSSSSSDGDTDFDEYLDGVGGSDDSDEETTARVERLALDLFLRAAARAAAPKVSVVSGDRDEVQAAESTQEAHAHAPAHAGGIKSARTSLGSEFGDDLELFKDAWLTSREIKTTKLAGSRKKRLREDALKLVRVAGRAGDDADLALALEPHLRDFATVVAEAGALFAEDGDAADGGGDGGGQSGDGPGGSGATSVSSRQSDLGAAVEAISKVQSDVAALRNEVAALSAALLGKGKRR